MSADGSAPCTRVKVCGLTREEDARLALDLGADYLGFVFAESPRRVAPSDVAAWLRLMSVGERRWRSVAVFARATRAEIETIFRRHRFDCLQLHHPWPGDPEDAALTWAASEGVDLLLTTTAAAMHGAPRVAPFAWLADTPARASTEAQGGSGIAFDWSALPSAPRPYRLFLAGGLSADNVEAAIQAASPFAVDASSRLESEPRAKDPMKLRAFFEAIARADHHRNQIVAKAEQGE